MWQLLRDHSLTIACYAIGSALVGIAWIWFDEGTKAFDTLLGYGLGLSTVAAFYHLAGFFRERNKPED
jgi:hypothetical protein